jgi:hypothetical protein
MSAGARRPTRGSLRIRLAQIATKGQISDRAGGRAGNVGYKGVAPGGRAVRRDEGLPSLSPIDGIAYHQGQLKTTEDVLRYNFKRYNLPLPEIHRGLFKDTLPDGLPGKICFAYLDGDLYESILVSLEHVYPKLAKGAVCLIDDYNDPSINPLGWNKLPGVKKACDEYLSNKPE